MSYGLLWQFILNRIGFFFVFYGMLHFSKRPKQKYKSNTFLSKYELYFFLNKMHYQEIAHGYWGVTTGT